MNVAHVTHAYPRWEGDIAGAFIARLVESLGNRGHTMRVVAPSDRGRGGTERLRGIPIERVRYGPGGRETLAYAGTMAEQASSPVGALMLTNLIRTQAAALRRTRKPPAAELWHAHWWVPGGISAWWARRRVRVPYVVTLHGSDVRRLGTSQAGRAIATRIVNGAARVTTVSSFLAKELERWTGYPASRVVVQPMPADVDGFTRMSRGGKGIVTVGRLTSQKRIDTVLRAVARLHAWGRPLPLTVVGDGPVRTELEHLTAELGIEHLVVFSGAVAPAAVPDAFGDADVSVFTATGEGFGLTAAESLMLGIPVVAAADGGGVLDVVPTAGAGRVVPPDDVDALANALDELQGQSAARAAAAAAGTEWKRRLAAPVVAESFERVYREATAGHQT